MTGVDEAGPAVAVILETAERARQRGLRADLTVADAACRVTGRLPAASDPEAVTDCLRTAPAEAGAERLDHVHAHATGTAQGDTAELAAVTAVAAELGTRRSPSPPTRARSVTSCTSPRSRPWPPRRSPCAPVSSLRPPAWPPPSGSNGSTTRGW
ncbi:hypothetical protein [Kitasatospora sp. NPDC001683]